MSAIDPEELLSVADNPDLEPIATEVGDRLRTAVERVDGVAPA